METTEVQVRTKQPKRAVAVGVTAKSHFDVILSDTDCFERALSEYREASWDESAFEELSFETQDAILRRAQEIKGCQYRLQSVLGDRHRIAS